MSRGELWALTATEAAANVARGELSAEQLARAFIDRITSIEPSVRAFAHLDREHALRQARELDERRRNGLPCGALHGVPVAVKDVIDTADYPTECGSPLFAGRRPLRDASVVSRLRAAGAVILGKTATTEFAFQHPGPTRNPRDPQRTPGGSSSGSAAAVAAAMVPSALGTQTNGSVIRPASFCGVFAMKPSHGLISRAGVLALSRQLDHVGVFARTLDDLALMVDTIAGHDPADPDTQPLAAPALRRIAAEKPPLPPRLAFVRTPIWSKADHATREAFEELGMLLGDSATALDLRPRFATAWDAHRRIMAADMAHNLGPLTARSTEVLSTPLLAFLEEGRKVIAIEYLSALADRQAFKADLAELFSHYDAILTPAAAGVAPKGLGATGDPAFCSLWTLTGLPALSLPILEGEGRMPLGVQLVGAAGDDGRLLRTAKWLLDALAGQKRRRPRTKRNRQD